MPLKLMKPKSVKLKRMKRRGGQRRTKSASLTCYVYQKDELIKRAHSRGMTISYYLNFLLWKDWVE
jgi:hypothetical protein